MTSLYVDGKYTRANTEALNQVAAYLLSLSSTLDQAQLSRYPVKIALSSNLRHPIYAAQALEAANQGFGAFQAWGMEAAARQLRSFAVRVSLIANRYATAEVSRRWQGLLQASVMPSSVSVVVGIFQAKGWLPADPASGQRVEYSMAHLGRVLYPNSRHPAGGVGEAARDIGYFLDQQDGYDSLLIQTVNEDGTVSSRLVDTSGGPQPPGLGMFKNGASAQGLGGVGPGYRLVQLGGSQLVAGGLGLTGTRGPQMTLRDLRPVEYLSTKQVADPSRQVKRVDNLSEAHSHGQIEIQKHTWVEADGEVKNSYSVLVAGTHDMGFGGSNPQDNATNLQLVGGLPTDQEMAIEQALEMVGAEGSEPIEFIGNSQAGGEIAKLCADPVFTTKYNVVSGLVLGGPTGAAVPAPQVEMLQVEITADAVPNLDGTPPPRADNLVVVKADLGAEAVAVSPHDIKNYNVVVQEIESSKNGDLEHWLQAHKDNLQLDRAGTTTTVYTFNTQRQP